MLCSLNDYKLFQLLATWRQSKKWISQESWKIFCTKKTTSICERGNRYSNKTLFERHNKRFAIVTSL